MKRLKLFLLVSLLAAIQLPAQVTIKGIVKDNKDKPVPGASIAIKDSYDGATADSAGRYSFRTTEKGKQLLVISNIGFKTVEQPISIEGAPITMDITLKQEVTELTAVVLSAGSFEASDRKRAAAVLDPIRIDLKHKC